MQTILEQSDKLIEWGTWESNCTPAAAERPTYLWRYLPKRILSNAKSTEGMNCPEYQRFKTKLAEQKLYTKQKQQNNFNNVIKKLLYSTCTCLSKNTEIWICKKNLLFDYRLSSTSSTSSPIYWLRNFYTIENCSNSFPVKWEMCHGNASK